MSPSEKLALRFIEKNGKASVYQIAEVLQIRRTSAATLIKRIYERQRIYISGHGKNNDGKNKRAKLYSIKTNNQKDVKLIPPVYIRNKNVPEKLHRQTIAKMQTVKAILIEGNKLSISDIEKITGLTRKPAKKVIEEIRKSGQVYIEDWYRKHAKDGRCITKFLPIYAYSYYPMPDLAQPPYLTKKQKAQK